MLQEAPVLPSENVVLVLGIGLSGRAAARLALAHGESVCVLDEGGGEARETARQDIEALGGRVFLNWREEAWPGGAKLVVISPGIPPDGILGRLARRAGCPVIGELEYGFRQCRRPVLAVTGTNGKTTTVELLTHCLQHAGFRACAAGNVGYPLCAAAGAEEGEGEALDFFVVEASSFQLETVDRFAPVAAAILNLSPDHMDRYHRLDDYYRAKTNLFANLHEPGTAIVRTDVLACPYVAETLRLRGVKPVLFSSRPGDAGVDFGVDATATHLIDRRSSSTIVGLAEMKLSGRHNIENALAAVALAAAVGIDPAAMRPGLTSFSPGAHRLQPVAAHRGVTYVNDSKSTNPDSLCRALEAIGRGPGGEKRILLLAGGLDKGLDFALATPFVRAFVKNVFLVGNCRERLAKLWVEDVSCDVFGDLPAAAAAAAKIAVSGDVVLLSPGCASVDMFSSYIERGVVFCEWVNRRVRS